MHSISNIVHGVAESLDREKALEAHVLHDCQNVLESRSIEKVNVPLGCKRLQNTLQASLLPQYFDLVKALLQLKLLVQLHLDGLKARVRSAHLFKQEERSAPFERFVYPIEDVLTVPRMNKSHRVIGNDHRALVELKGQQILVNEGGPRILERARKRSRIDSTRSKPNVIKVIPVLMVVEKLPCKCSS
jgi:hypothetical protein